jgi:nucleoid DNA-binding protein
MKRAVKINDLINSLASLNPDVSYASIKTLTYDMIAFMADCIVNDEEIHINNFGKIKITMRAPVMSTKSYFSKTKGWVYYKVCKFKPSKLILETLNKDKINKFKAIRQKYITIKPVTPFVAGSDVD